MKMYRAGYRRSGEGTREVRLFLIGMPSAKMSSTSERRRRHPLHCHFYSARPLSSPLRQCARLCLLAPRCAMPSGKAVSRLLLGDLSPLPQSPYAAHPFRHRITRE